VRIPLLLESPVEPKRDIATRVVFEIVAGEPAGQCELELAEVDADEASAATGIIFLV
jgi:hypothetical protein